MGMSFINWVGFVMLLLALLLNGIPRDKSRYQLNIMAILAGVTWLVVAAALSMWPNQRDQNA